MDGTIIDLDQSTLSRNLGLLEREGLVEIVTAEKDLRRRAVWLTEKGASRLEAAMPVWRAAHAALAAVIRPEQVRALASKTQNLVKSGTRPSVLPPAPVCFVIVPGYW
jgi:DNA-binding MarR family transcriptional regulator